MRDPSNPFALPRWLLWAARVLLVILIIGLVFFDWHPK
jgi:hypothetical protein